jgi:hypothetical protein
MREEYHRYWLKPVGTGILLSGDRAITGSADSIAMEFDSSGHRIFEIDFQHGKVQHIDRATFDRHGRLLKSWVDFDRTEWQPPQTYFYDQSGNLVRTETYDARGTVCTKRDIRRTENEVLELDSSFIPGRSPYTSRQLTTYDSLGRVKDYRYFSESAELMALHEPVGSYYVYSDTIGRYTCREFAYEHGEWSEEPWRIITFDSAKREEIKVVVDTSRERWVTKATYLPDERIVRQHISKDGEPILEHICQYNARLAMTRKETRDHLARKVTISEFTYLYSTTGP